MRNCNYLLAALIQKLELIPTSHYSHIKIITYLAKFIKPLPLTSHMRGFLLSFSGSCPPAAFGAAFKDGYVFIEQPRGVKMVYCAHAETVKE